MAEDPAVESVLCVPGPWGDGAALVAAVTQADPGYLALGRALLHFSSKTVAGVEVHPADPAVTRAFAAAGAHWAGTEQMAAIAEHGAVAYVIGRGGTRERAEALMGLGTVLLDLGGLGVKVESAGVAHAPSHWRDLTARRELATAYRAWVVTVTGSSAVTTCGMHNLGLPEVLVDPAVPHAAAVVSDLAHHLVAEAPVVEPGHTAALGPDRASFVLQVADAVDYGDGDPFTNPFGAWRLVPV